MVTIMLQDTSVNFEQSGAAQEFLLRVRRTSADDAEATGQVNAKHVIGLAPMARVTTSFGEVYAQALRKGDMVRTTNGHFLRIEHVDRIRFDEDFIRRYPAVLPVKMHKNSLGPGLPKVDTMLAPYQMVRPGMPRVTTQLAPAIELLARPFVNRGTENQITYTVIRLEKPAEIYCEGLAIPV